MSASRTVLGRLFQSLGAKQKRICRPQLILIFSVLSNGQSFEIVADVKDYNAIRDRTSTEGLSHSGLYK